MASAVALASSGLFLGANAWSAQPAPTPAPEKPSSSLESPKPVLPLNELRTFADVFDRIKQAYVEEVDDKTLLNNAIKGMLSELDPHSAYLEPQDFEDLQINTSGEFGGIGIEVGMEDGFVKVISPIDDTPAAKAGVQAGDLIIKLDDTPVKGLSLTEAVNLMRGKPGSNIKLTIIRSGIPEPLEINVKRAVIQVQSVRKKMLEPGYAYVRLAQFQMHSGADVRKAIEKLQADYKESSGKTQLSGLILDLRNNPGGVLQAAVEVCDLFLDSGLIVYTKGRLPDSDMQFSATPGDMVRNVPIIVLVNGGSASASEIVAGALQDQKRAVIVGTTTFGKGSVQTVLPLSEDRALKLTTARYYTPNGRSIQAQGIVPDISVERAELTRAANDDFGVREADLTRHLENPSSKDKKDKGKKDGTSETKPTTQNVPLEQQDYQLYEALNLLKAMNVISQRQAR
ncbi:Peptidase S41A, C-terminal protease [gamma proteobacterium HdN1]|nr:Peptidase S41A, C-terminal protease [gamma proteobacterium HdN1]